MPSLGCITIIRVFFNLSNHYCSNVCVGQTQLKIKLNVCLSKQKKRAVLHQTHYVELLMVVDNERVSYVNLAASFTIFPLSDVMLHSGKCQSVVALELLVRVEV